jgi:uncharacterized protein (TIGR00288 family)
MAKRIGVFCDISNMYYCIGKKFRKRKLDYKKYLAYAKELGDIAYAIAYGAQMQGEAAFFIQCLKNFGYEPKYKAPKNYHNRNNFRRKADWDVGITMDIVRKIDDIDMIILGTADGDLTPLVEWAKERGKSVIILACGISRELKDAATTFIEIPESMLEETDAQPVVEGQPDARSYNGKDESSRESTMEESDSGE